MHRLFVLALSLLAAALCHAADRVVSSPPPSLSGGYPMACSNLAIDPAKLSRSGVAIGDLWTGIVTNGQTHYLSDVLAEPGAALSQNVVPPIDGTLYPRFGGKPLPLVSLLCYPTTADSPRPSYTLPDGQVLPHMERSGDAPMFADPAARYPLIVFSHGMGGSPVDGATLLLIGRLVGEGYVVLAPFHGDQRIGVVQIESLGDVWNLVKNFGNYVELQALRPLGVKTSLDQMLARSYATHIDTQRIGGFGGSMGGEAMMLAMGAQLTTSILLDSRGVTQDPRIKAAVGYVPYSGQSFLPAFGLGQNGAASMHGPFLAISGSADIIAPIDMTQKALNKMPGTRYLVELQGVPHGFEASYAGDVLGWLLPFFGAYLKDDAASLDRLSRMSDVSGGLTDTLLTDVALPTALQDGQVQVSEYYNARTGNYLNVIGDDEVALVDAYASQGWAATGQGFKAWRAVSESDLPVCRFYQSAGKTPLDGSDSLFISTEPALCVLGRSLAPQWFDMGSPIALAAQSADGSCPAGTQTLGRAMRVGSRPGELDFRFSTSDSELRALGQNGWTVDATQMCAPL